MNRADYYAQHRLFRTLLSNVARACRALTFPYDTEANRLLVAESTEAFRKATKDKLDLLRTGRLVRVDWNREGLQQRLAYLKTRNQLIRHERLEAARREAELEKLNAAAFPSLLSYALALNEIKFGGKTAAEVTP